MSSDQSNADVASLSLFLQGHDENTADLKKEEALEIEVLKLKLEKQSLQFDLERERTQKMELQKMVYSENFNFDFRRLFNSANLDLTELELQYVENHQRIHYLEGANKTLTATIYEAREQIGKIFKDYTRKCKVVDHLKSELWKVNQASDAWSQQLEEQANLLDSMSKEIESLKAQKEDIVNHSKNSEKMWNERVATMTADMERLMAKKSKNVEEEESNELIEKLEKQLQEAQEKLDQSQFTNRLLNVEVKHTRMLEATFWGDRSAFDDERKMYETQVAELNEEVKGLEKMAEKMRQKFEEVSEQLNKQTITFKDEKAKFCDDMERLESKWNSEVLKLNQQKETLIIEEQRKSMEMKRKGDLEKAKLREEIERLTSSVEYSEEKLKTTVNEWDVECAGLEDEIYTLIDERKKQSKVVASMKRKNQWLAKSIKAIAQQRREDIQIKEAMIRKLNDRCELLRKEKVEWLSDLKEEVNAWKDETSERMEMQTTIDEIRRANEELEEKVEAVTEKWRSEVETYEATVASLQEERIQERDELYQRVDELVNKEETLNAAVKRLEEAKKTMTKEMEEQRRAAVDVVHKTVQASNTALINLRQSNEREKFKILNEKDETIRVFEKLANELRKDVEIEKSKCEEANITIAFLKDKLDNISIAKVVLSEEIEKLNKDNENLRSNMGVEELDDVENSDANSDDDDAKSTSDESESGSEASSEESDEYSFEKCTCGQCPDSSFEDMPELDDESSEKGEVEEKPKKKKKKEEEAEWDIVLEAEEL